MFDVAVIGGGINGCGIAREAALRGASVYLCEQDDLASGTSSASTKLIHGGLRYLEHYEFRLVREALREREVLWGMAPHIIAPLRFVLPYQEGLRPAWLLRLGLFVYDHMGGRQRLPATRHVDLSAGSLGTPLKHGADRFGFEYSDCWVDDARLTLLNAVDAAARGAKIETRKRAVHAQRRQDHWLCVVEDTETGARDDIHCKALVNAAGPWVGQVLGTLPTHREARVRLVQGSHIVVRKLYDHDRAYIFQNRDGRVVFTIPYENDFTLIGTTDRDYHGDPAQAAITPSEIEYLCAAASEYLARGVTPDQIVWTYSGVRPLYDDGARAAQAATRDYVLDLEEEANLPLLSIIGGKITTYRRLALHALRKLSPYLRANFQERWQALAPLPGGDFPIEARENIVARLNAAHPWLSPRDLERLHGCYGTRIRQIIGDADGYAALGRPFGAGLYAAEVDYLVRQEFARTAADIVWRRTKLGLRLAAEEIAGLDTYLQQFARAEIKRGGIGR